MPTATKLKDYEGWKKEGAFVKKNPIWIKILEPAGEYTRTNGEKGIIYNHKNMLDVSQVNLKEPDIEINYNIKMKLSALLYNAPVFIQPVNKLDEVVKYDREDITIYVKKGVDANELFHSLVKEIASVYLNGDDSELNNFYTESISYLVCKKNAIETKLNISSMPSFFLNEELYVIRKELEKIRKTAEKINDGMFLYFEKQKDKPKQMERS